MQLTAKLRIHTLQTPFPSGAVLTRMLVQSNVKGCLGLIVGVLQPCNQREAQHPHSVNRFPKRRPPHQNAWYLGSRSIIGYPGSAHCAPTTSCTMGRHSQSADFDRSGSACSSPSIVEAIDSGVPRTAAEQVRSRSIFDGPGSALCKLTASCTSGQASDSIGFDCSDTTHRVATTS